MTALLTPDDVAAFLGVLDRRTVARRLAELQVPVVPLGRSYRVRVVDLERAVAAAVVVTVTERRGDAIGGTLAPGRRLWDPDPSTTVGPRRVNGRPLGTQGGEAPNA